MEFRRVLFRSWDFIISSLVAHHMSNAERLAFLDFMERHASRGWFVNDLYRHAFASHGFPLLARLLRVHPIVREDGQLSIARAFRPAEWSRSEGRRVGQECGVMCRDRGSPNH